MENQTLCSHSTKSIFEFTLYPISRFKEYPLYIPWPITKNKHFQEKVWIEIEGSLREKKNMWLKNLIVSEDTVLMKNVNVGSNHI